MKARTETLVSMPVLNPSTGRKCSVFGYTGKVDLTEQRKITDWKSAADPMATIKSKALSFQAEMYALAEMHGGTPIDEVEYRIIARPSIKLCQKDANLAEINGTTPEAEYEARCVEWINADPAKRLITHNHILTPSRLASARLFLWNVTRRIIANRKSGGWLPNAGNCGAFNKECEFMLLCQLAADGADIAYAIAQYFDELDDPHVELDEKTTRDIITYSSSSTFAACEAKYFWQYERGLRKKNDHSDALWVGSAMHEGLEWVVNAGLEAGHDAVDRWVNANPSFDLVKQNQNACKARAMVTAAADYWNL